VQTDTLHSRNIFLFLSLLFRLHTHSRVSAEMCKSLGNVVEDMPADTPGADMLRAASGNFPSGRPAGQGKWFAERCDA
jgi:hypothetical protein